VKPNLPPVLRLKVGVRPEVFSFSLRTVERRVLTPLRTGRPNVSRLGTGGSTWFYPGSWDFVSATPGRPRLRCLVAVAPWSGQAALREGRAPRSLV